MWKAGRGGTIVSPAPMTRTCVIVADTQVARFYAVEQAGSSRQQSVLVGLAELTREADLKSLGRSVSGRPRTETNTNRQAGPRHPIGAQRERHRVDLERRFGQAIVRQAARIVRGWADGVVILVAEPGMLGLVRRPLRRVLRPRVKLKELAKDYTRLTSHELLELVGPHGA